MPLFPNHETPPTKKIIFYCVIIVLVMIVLGYLLPGGNPLGG